jgi:FkbM family methyltransferase
MQNDLTKMDSLSLASLGLPDRLFFFRPGSTDEWVIDQVFRHHQYAFDQWALTAEILDLVARRAAQGKKPLIIDAGANIGAAAVYFALKMPSARIVAIEPAADNFAVLERNTAGLDAELHLAALGTPGRVRSVDLGLGAWGYRTERAQDGADSVPVLSINQIYSAHAGEAFPLIVKVDIEGDERGLFAQDTEWVRQTPVIFVEPHDWMLPKQSTVRNFLALMAGQERDILVQHENIVAVAHDLG